MVKDVNQLQPPRLFLQTHLPIDSFINLPIIPQIKILTNMGFLVSGILSRYQMLVKKEAPGSGAFFMLKTTFLKQKL